MDLPETIRRRLEDFSRTVLFDQSRSQPLSKENGAFLPHGKLPRAANVASANQRPGGVRLRVHVAEYQLFLTIRVCSAAVLFSDKRVLSSLHLQMSLYFNMWFFPLWWVSETVMLHLKVRQREFNVSTLKINKHQGPRHYYNIKLYIGRKQSLFQTRYTFF